jgi:tocopherol O-methyltransferase
MARGTTQTVDVGCGIGGSSRHIAAKYGSSGKGITLSPVQVPMAMCRYGGQVTVVELLAVEPGAAPFRWFDSLCNNRLQAARANALTAEQGLDGRVSFQVADALHMPFSDGGHASICC